LDKPANNQYPIHELIQKRWSPLAFSDRAVEPDKIRSLLEAARWTASCFNEQPWQYIIAIKDNLPEFDRLLNCLVEGNREWAKNAPVLMLSLARLQFTKSGKDNKHAWHDVGAASNSLTIQATALGLYVHQMAGFDPEIARVTYGIPEGYEPIAAIALGYPGDPHSLSASLQERQFAPRQRHSVDNFVFTGKWGETSPIFDLPSR
jgi:nitroreductase